MPFKAERIPADNAEQDKTAFFTLEQTEAEQEGLDVMRELKMGNPRYELIDATPEA